MKKFSLLSAFLCFALLAAAALCAAPAKTLVGTIPIGPDNPRNSEGDFIRLKSGDILYVYTHYYGNRSGDNDPAYLALRRSADDGRTWSGEDELVLPNEGKLNLMSVTLRRMNDGRIALFYLVKESEFDCRPYLRFSDDEGKTWGARIELVSEPSYNVVNNDRVAILSNGRILVPTARHPIKKTEKGQELIWSAEIFCLISDDGGATWCEGELASNPGGVLFQEPGVCELADGRLLLNIRTDAGSQYFAYSSDGGESWSEPRASALDSPISPAVIKRIPGSDDLLAVWNPLRAGRTSGNGSRAFMYYGRLSPDGGELLGRRFIVSTLDSDDQNWQYPAVLFNGDGTFLTAFFSWKEGVRIYRIDVPEVTELFNGRDLTGWTKYLRGRETGEDPENVFSVRDGAIRVSGAEWGGISCGADYSDFHASLEFKWGEETYGPRKSRARDSGFLFHAGGEEGGFARIWLKSYEANIVEGGIGDFWMVTDDADGYAATCRVTEKEGQRVFDPNGGEEVTITRNSQGPFRWSGFDPQWRDEKGFRGRNEIARPGEWTRLEVVAEGDTAEFYVDGVLVNRVTNLTRTSGRFQLQSEGAEVFFRNVTVTK